MAKYEDTVFHVLLLCLATTANYLVQQSSFLKHDSDNIRILDNLLFETEADTSLQCVAICKRTPRCRTLSVTSPPSAATVTCRGHTSLVENSTLDSSPSTSLWITESDWLERACNNDLDCPVPLSECYQGSCLCSPGYYFSHTQNTCLDACPDEDLQSPRFLAYPTIRILNNNAPEGCIYNLSLTECLRHCAQYTYCRTCDFFVTSRIKGMRCCAQLVTVLDVPDMLAADNDSVHYQRTCV